ncbi:NMDA receptor synaptonuclear signaling and neuronal migration factor [Sapajus apella]|uniref:NMDA receptor synaptonuclear signaling and neuronal migration factor n=1 Tax=Sapajus apella TaxID=9515 RepID=A0A6J3GK26_SAPAP|nr:NMDA receptor synaptonuclear signaling and neuronal migration factor [Sapajus apella]
MGAAASRRRALRSEAMSSVAAKVRAARAFGEYLSQSHPESRNGADHLLADAYSGHDGSPEMQPAPQNKRRLSLVSNGCYEGSLSEEPGIRKPAGEGPQPRVYTISGEPALLPSPEAEAIELAVVKGRRQRHTHHHSQPLRASPGGSREDVSRPCQSWAGSRQGSKECPGCAQLAPGPTPRAFGLDQPPLPEAPGRRKKLERMYSVDRVSDDTPIRTWFPKENLFSFQTATTTMQAISVFRGYAERKRRKRENDSASVIQRNFRKHLRMVGSRRVKAQSKIPRGGGGGRQCAWPVGALRAASCAENVPRRCGGEIKERRWGGSPRRRGVVGGRPRTPPTCACVCVCVRQRAGGGGWWRNEQQVLDHSFLQGGPGHLYLLKNKVATFAKVEKEEDMIHFWKRLSRLMSKVNPEPNVIHIMGCYILGNPNGEKLFQNLRTLMTPYRVTFESPLELSAQGKQMIETYFDFRLYRLWKSRQHSKLLDFDDVL